MKRALVALAAIAAVLVAIVLLRAVGGAEPGRPSAPPTPIAVDADAALERFAAALRLPTVSHDQDSGVARDDDAFVAFHRLLERSYPRVHATLRRETVADYTLLYTWPGRDPELEPIVLMGHFDVVPVDPETLDHWSHPPFAGVVADGRLWGRGSIDDKINVMAQLEAAEALLAEGFAPARTLLMSFGHDEELGGSEGAAGVVALLEERGVRPALVVDEGGAVIEGAFPGLERPLAAIGIAEKGYVSVELTVETPGGHSSAPPAHTAVGILASAIHALERSPLPSHFGGSMKRTLEAIAPHTGFGPRVVLGNLWLFGPIVERVLLGMPNASPLLRTTTAATLFHAGIKDNVLPNKARAVVNFRIFPGDSIDSVVEHVRDVIDDERIVLIPSRKRREPSGGTAVGTEAFEMLAETVRRVYPDAIPAPYLIPGGTDSRHFRAISEGVFGFMPVRTGLDDLKRAHGQDESIGVDAYLEGIRFYAQLMRDGGDWQ